MSNSEKPTARVRTRKTIDRPEGTEPKIVYKSKSEPRAPRREGGDRPQRSFGGGDRPARNFGGDDRPRRSFDGDRNNDRPRTPRADGDRPQRNFGGDRPARNFGGDDRPRRSFDGDRNNDRPRTPRADGDRPQRNFGGDRPQRNFGGDDRPRRSFDGDRNNDRPRAPRADGDRPQRSFGGDRPQRSFGGDRPQRNFGGDDRPRRSFDGDRNNDRPRAPRREGGDRPQRSFGGDRPQRNFGGDDRPRRSFDGDRNNDRPRAPRADGDRPQRSFGGDRPQRNFGGDDRPRRSFDGDRNNDRPRAPRREGGDRPRGNFGGDRPQRNFGGDRPARNFGGDDRPRAPRADGDDKISFNNVGESSKEDTLKRYENLTSADRQAPRYEKSFGGNRAPSRIRDDKRERKSEPSFAPAKRTAKPHAQKGNFFTSTFGHDKPVKQKDKNKEADDAYFERVAEHMRKREEQQARYDAEFEREELQEDEQMPLNKYLAHSGVSGRREAAEIVKSGRVLVNDEVITEPGYKVQAGDKVVLDGKAVNPEIQLVYLLVNKPKDYITTTDDEKDRKTVLDLVEGVTEQRVYPIGRLDRNTSGLIILTNDGELTQKLSHPKFKVKKLYQVNLDKPLTKEHYKEIFNGIELEDGLQEVDDLAYIDAEDLSKIGIQIHSGKNRVVRRIFESLGYEVKQLDRVMYANLTKKNIPRGKWRSLTAAEVRQLKSSRG
jgi:23S rRNA pseudouridine2605 synthase